MAKDICNKLVPFADKKKITECLLMGTYMYLQ